MFEAVRYITGYVGTVVITTNTRIQNTRIQEIITATSHTDNIILSRGLFEAVVQSALPITCPTVVNIH